MLTPAENRTLQAVTMSTNYRKTNGTLRVAGILLLCMTSTLIVGFSKPVYLVDDSASTLPTFDGTNTDAITRTLDLSLSTREPSLREPSLLVPLIQPSAARPPESFVTDALLEPILGEVSHRQWVKPARFSPDRARAEAQGELHEAFHGVGFPDIRTHDKTHRLVSFTLDEPSNWNPMVAWRESGADDEVQEPIAHVRCMGLSPQAVAKRADRFESLILETGLEFNVSVSLIKAIVTEESCFNSQALSPVGAQGLMQLMPDTAQWLKVTDPLDPLDNLRAGVRYIAALQEQFDTLELALAAYNAGPGNVRRYKGVPPFAETQAYVQKVKAHYRRYLAATQLALR